MRVGGFSRAPRRSEIEHLRRAPDEARPNCRRRRSSWWPAFRPPPFEREPISCRSSTSDRVPASTTAGSSRRTGSTWPRRDWREAFEEQHAGHQRPPRPNEGRPRLPARTGRPGHPERRAAPSAGARGARAERPARQIARNPYWSIAARAVELIHAVAEARDIVDGYVPPAEPVVAWTPRAAHGAWATEAPRGLLFHRYELDERGLIAEAQIVPPTSQNQGAIEQDLALFAPEVLSLPARRGDSPPRAAHPGVRPVHQLRHALPGPADRGGRLTA